MSAAKRAKASDKQGVCKKLITLLKKHYKPHAMKNDGRVLDTILQGACLENASVEAAETAYERLNSSFYGLNEIRVSSITEIASVLKPLDDPEHRALKIRATLHYVFEKQFDFDLEILRRKTMEQTIKYLNRIKELSPFVRNYTLQAGLASHVIPCDDAMCRLFIWLGLVDHDATPETAAEAMKSAVRKADAPAFCALVRAAATDSRLAPYFASETESAEADQFDLDTAASRLEAVLKNPPSARKATRKKKVAKKAAAAKTSKKSKPAKTTKKSAATKKRVVKKKKKTAATKTKKKKKPASK